MYTVIQCACVYTVIQCSCVYTVIQCACVCTVIQCACVYTVIQCSCVYTVIQCACVYTVIQCACVYTVIQCACVCVCIQCVIQYVHAMLLYCTVYHLLPNVCTNSTQVLHHHCNMQSPGAGISLESPPSTLASDELKWCWWCQRRNNFRGRRRR